MAVFKCKMCGGELEITSGLTVAECEYCGTKQTLSKSSDEVVTNLFARANNLRLKCEFDKAEQVYEKILDVDNTDSEAHWGIVLCKYGIEYVEDPKTYKRVPTCHRTLYEAITTDANYISAIENADSAQKVIYEQEAKAIGEIQKDILNIVNGEKPFDVFICYKETDEDGKRTPDSVIANDIYYQLTQEGFKVFYAAITLEDKLGREYEPYIFAALNSAKVMLVVGTKPQYFDAVWVRNEWSRFLKLTKTDRQKLLIPCYRDMDAYELPDAFSHLQAQDMSKIGFINDVVRGIKKLINKEEEKTAPIKESATVTTTANVAPLLKRAFMFLEDGDWTNAVEYCEKVLDSDPECALAYVGKLLADLRVNTQEELKNCEDTFEKNNNYLKAIRFANENLKKELIGYNEYIFTRNENALLEEKYTRAKNIMNTATYDGGFIHAASIFETLADYKDSSTLMVQCREKAEIARKDSLLLRATSLIKNEFALNDAYVTNYEKALGILEDIPGWKDADELSELCKNKITEIKEKIKADKLESERKAEEERIARQLKAKKRKKLTAIVAAAACVVIAFIIVLITVIIPNSKYNEAIALMDAGELDEAYSAFIELGGYKDAVDKAGDLRLQKNKDQLKNIKVGSYVNFGAYEQDNNTSNGKEEVEWFVLEVKDGKALVISKYALDCQKYNTSNTEVTWETCTLRKWLNNDFLGAAFSADEKAMIPTVTVSADKNSDYGTNPGNATQDQVFLLSIAEANKYFNSDSARQCEPTNYAVASGAYKNSSNGNCWWWLRSPGLFQNEAANVDDVGDVREYGSSVNNTYGAVRPAMWISLN